MNQIKKYLGLVWMALAPIIILLLLSQAIQKTKLAVEASKANTLLQWIIILIVFAPICIGFFVFGWYAFKDAYSSKQNN